jgi:polyribonucleotide 5'-hydroxyl-kinase
MADSTQTHTIAAETELRVDVPKGSTCTVKLLEGLAEVFGMELSKKQEYKYEGPTHFAIFTWYPDCKVELSGVPQDAAYAADDTQMNAYAGIHGRLNWKRDEARRIGADGPRVLIVGPTDSGKSTLCQILLAYGVRAGYAPVFVDLDVGQGALSIPGAIGAAVLSPRELTPHRGINASRPLVYWYGDKTPDSKTGIGDGRYGSLVSTMADAVDDRTANEEAIRSSGVIVNMSGRVMSGRVDEIGYQEILHVVRCYSIELVLVLGHDRLHAKLNKELSTNINRKGPRLATNPKSSIVTVKLPRSGGAIERNPTLRKNARANAISQYFYGDPLCGINLSPMQQHVNFSEIDLYSMVGASASTLNSGLMSLGGSMGAAFGSSEANSQAATCLVALDVDQSLLHSVLAVVHHSGGKGTAVASDTDSLLRELGSCSVAGFVAVKAINMDTRTLTLLSPTSEALPTRCLVRGSVTWLDQ